MVMTDFERRQLILAIADDTIFGILILSAAFLIVSAGLSLMKWVGVF